MLEIEMQKLTAAIERLTATLEGQGALALDAQKTAKVQKKTFAVVAVEDAPQATLEAEAAPEVITSKPKHSAGELQAKCLEIVKADRSKKQAIVGLIAKHTDGKGKLVKDVPASNLDALAADLEALA